MKNTEQINSAVLRNVVETAPFMTELLQNENILVGVVDLEKYLYYAPGKTLDAKVNTGEPFYDHDLFGQVIHNRKRTIIKTPPEYGEPFKGVGIPIFDNSELVGCLGIGISLDQEYQFLEIIQSLEGLSDHIQGRAHNMLSQTEELSATVQEIAAHSESVKQNSGEINEVTQFINNVSEQSNLLGLNAAIEAARAGEQGRTFSVVAKEIRKMAKDSSHATDKIKTVIDDIMQNIEQTSEQLTDIAQAVQSQEAEAETFSQMTEELNEMTNKLKTHIEVLTNEIN
ncbi:methyl-accepting chemotaxis protein [Cerasibacillus sp. JNUCC 74]